MYNLIIKKSARKELDNIPNPFFLKIDEAVLDLKDNPYPYPQSKKLKGEDNHRLRVGDFRVVYTVMEIIHVSNRGFMTIKSVMANPSTKQTKNHLRDCKIKCLLMWIMTVFFEESINLSLSKLLP